MSCMSPINYLFKFVLNVIKILITKKFQQIYELLSGALIVTIVFETPLWAVVMDPTQTSLFVGGQDSNIYETKLYKRPSNSSQKQIKPQFVGHESDLQKNIYQKLFH